MHLSLVNIRLKGQDGFIMTAVHILWNGDIFATKITIANL